MMTKHRAYNRSGVASKERKGGTSVAAIDSDEGGLVNGSGSQPGMAFSR